MDTVTHGLTGWLVSRPCRGVEPERGDRRGDAGAVLPDADHIATLVAGARCTSGSTGGSPLPVRVTVSSLVVALLFARFGHWKDRKRLSCSPDRQLSHVALDLLNAYGRRCCSRLRRPFLAGPAVRRGPGCSPASSWRGSPCRGAATRAGRGSRWRSSRGTSGGSGAPRPRGRRRGATPPCGPASRWSRRTPCRASPRWSSPTWTAWGSQPGRGLDVRGPRGWRRDVRSLPRGPLAWDGFIDDGRTYCGRGSSRSAGRWSGGRERCAGPTSPR